MDRTGQSLLGKYELTRMLGKGGMGEVWEGEHSLTGRRVAVKILADNYLQNKKVVARFGREARAASAINHPGIVEILDQDRTPDGVPFLVMEFLEGESVGERIRGRGKLSQDEALAIMLPLLDALDAAHHAGIIHRDLKPDNVFILPGVRGEERVKILDFGISQKSDEIENRLTQEGSVLGTPHYMSPEQAKGEAGIDGRVDVYAAGVMFYECVVGDVPFDAGNYNALMQIILGTPPPPPRSRGADISAAVEQVMLASMDKNRKRRPPSARAFHDLLLEAGMQEDDATLDVETWSFSTPSEPPPVEFGDMSEGDVFGGLPPEDPFDAGASPLSVDEKPAARGPQGARGGTLDDFESAPARSPAAVKNSLGELDDLEADLFAQPPQAKPKFDSLTPSTSIRAPTRPVLEAPGPRLPSPEAPGPRGGPSPFEARSNPFESKPGGAMFDPAPRIGGNDLGGRGPQGASAARPNAGSQQPLDRPKPERRPVPLAPAPGHGGASDSMEPGIARTVLNWLITLVAVGALGYLIQIVFTRPDPRKKSAPTSPTTAGEVHAAEPAAP